MQNCNSVHAESRCRLRSPSDSIVERLARPVDGTDDKVAHQSVCLRTKSLHPNCHTVRGQRPSHRVGLDNERGFCRGEKIEKGHGDVAAGLR